MTQCYSDFQVRTVLVLQKQEALDQQRDQVMAVFHQLLPGVLVTMAGAVEEVPESADFDAVICPTLPWLPQALERLGSYRWIHFLSAGVDLIWDMPFPKEDVILTRSSGVHGAPISEYVIGALLYFYRGLDGFVRQAKDRRWERTWLDELTGKRMLILGMGAIGSTIAERARVFGVEVTGVQRRPSSDHFGVDIIALEALKDALPTTDILVVCLPLTETTRGLVDSDLLSRLRPGALLIDVSRGGVVREEAVLEALESGALRAAALDVFEQEPLPESSPLWAHPQVLLTPHVSSSTPQYMPRALEIFAANARALEAGEELVTPVDAQAGY